MREELEGCKALLLATLKSSLDLNRAIAMLAGRTRVTTLKRHVTVFQQWRLWLLEAKQLAPPGRPSDLVDYLLARRDEPCRKSIPELIMKAICWMEKVAKFCTELRWAAVAENQVSMHRPLAMFVFSRLGPTISLDLSFSRLVAAHPFLT